MEIPNPANPFVLIILIGVTRLEIFILTPLQQAQGKL